MTCLRVCDAIDAESNRRGKADLKRIVSMLTRLIQRDSTVRSAIEYEYETATTEYDVRETRNLRRNAKPDEQRRCTRVADRTAILQHRFIGPRPSDPSAFCGRRSHSQSSTNGVVSVVPHTPTALNNLAQGKDS